MNPIPMLRKKKENQINFIKPPKVVPILFSAEMPASAHILNLREKLSRPEKPPALAWQSSVFDRLLSQPLKELKAKAQIAAKPKPLVVEEGIFRVTNISSLLIRTDSRSRQFWHRLEPALSRAKGSAASFKLPHPSLPHLPWPKFDFLTGWQKGLASFILTALILTLPLPALSTYAQLKDTQIQIVSLGSQAFNHLEASQSALLAQNLAKAATDLQTALELFSQTQKELNEINPVLKALFSTIPGLRRQYLNGEHLMVAGSNLSLATLPLVQAVNSVSDEPLTDQLNRLAGILTQVLPKFQAVKRHLNLIKVTALPDNERQTFLAVRQKVEVLTVDLEKMQPLMQTLATILGAQEPKRYLLIFQNDNEIRPTGGFIGSFALLDLAKGKIKKLDLPGGGPYDLQGSLKVAILPPAPLQLLKSRWELQDANWFPDFPASAQKIAWFYEKSGGPTVDGVMALDTYLLIELLKITGEIAMPEYGLTINAQNFVTATQKQVEIDYDKTQNKPKQFLADLAPKILDKLFSTKENFLPIVRILNQNLNQRHLQLYLADPLLEQVMAAQGWGGELKNNPQGDYLLVINTNIAGGKTDGVIKQTLQHQAKIEIDGSIVNRVTIRREHQGKEGDLFTNLQNVSYLRLYAPANSQLIQAEGFTYPEEKHFKVADKRYKIDEDLKRIEQNQTIDEQSGTMITQEFGKTSFGNWVMTKPGQSTTVSFTYKLPYQIADQDKDLFSYSLLVQKQAGSLADNFSSSIIWPPSWQIIWHDQAEATKQNNQIFFSTDLQEDQYLGLVLQIYK